MEHRSYSVRLPGKLVLSGEYSVLCGFNAIAFNINRYVKIAINPIEPKAIIINSHYYGSFRIDIEQLYSSDFDIKNIRHFDKILAVIKDFQYIDGLYIDVLSEIEPIFGFGSSGAIIAGMTELMIKITNINLTQDGQGDINKNYILNRAIQISNKFNYLGSGIDIATSLYDSLIEYNMTTKEVRLLSDDFFRNNFDIYAIYSGIKVSTSNILGSVDMQDAGFYGHCVNISRCTERIKKSILENNVSLFFESILENQRCLEMLGVSNQTINEIIAYCVNNNFAAKISGAGFGDSIICFVPKNTLFHIDKYQYMKIR